MKSDITIRLDADFASALRFYKKNDARHLSLVEQVRRALICYWTAQETAPATDALVLALPEFNGPDFSVSILPEDEPSARWREEENE
jgi:hypothetical protein